MLGIISLILLVAASWRAGRAVSDGLELDPWTTGISRVVVAFACAVGVLTVLAAAHQLKALPIALVFGAILVLTGPVRVTGGRPPWSRDMWGSTSVPHHGPLVLAMVVTGWYWVRQTLGAAQLGIEEFDSLHYHLPHAARMAQDGHLWAVNVVTPSWPVHFYPSNVELLQAAVLIAIDSDVPIVLFGLTSLVLFVLAGLAVTVTTGARDTRVAAVLTATGLLVVGNGGTIGYLGPGTAGNDLFVTAAVLAAVVLVVRPPTDARVSGIAGLAVGLAAGTKLTALLPAAALLVWVAVRRPRRARSVAAFVAAALFAGSVWYLRNLLAAGNPVPGLDLAPMRVLFDTVPFPTTEQWGISIAELRGGREAWSRLAQGWTAGHGVFWPGLVGLTVFGIVAGWRRDGTTRALSLFTAVSLVGYIFTPWTAFGPDAPDIMLVAATTRYALIPLSLGMILAAVAVAGNAVKERVMAVVLVISLAGTLRPLDAGFASLPLAALAAMIVVAVTALVVVSLVRGRSKLIPVAAVLVIGVTLALPGVAGGKRYAEPGEPYTAISRWASTHEHVRIGHTGWFATYLLYGDHRANTVRSLRVGDALGEDGAPTTCAELVDSMTGFDVVVLGPWMRWADSFLAVAEEREDEDPVRSHVIRHPDVRVIIDQARYALIDTSDLPPAADICSDIAPT